MRQVVAIALCIALTASACSALPSFDEFTGRSDAMQWLTDRECAALQLSREGAIATESIPLEGWPGASGEDWGAVVAQVTSSEVGPDDGYLAIVADWEEVPRLRVPVHPSEDPEGGPIEVRFGQLGDEDESRWCDERHPVTIQPLPPASPEDGVRAQLEELTIQAEAAAAVADSSIEQLIDLEVEQVPPELVPVAIAAHLVQDDGVAALLDGLDPQERDLADRVMAHSRARTDVDPDAEAVADLAKPRPASAREAPTAPQVQRASFTPPDGGLRGLADPVHAAPRLLTVAENGADGCITTSFEQLSTLLGRQLSGSTMISGGTETTIDLALTVGQLPIISRWALSTAITAWATKATAEYLANMLPSEWEESNLTYAPETLFEDDVDGGEVEAFTMRMSSTGWDTGPIMAELGLIIADIGISAGLRRLLRPSPRMGQPGVVELFGEPVWTGDAGDLARNRVSVVSEFLSWTITNVAAEAAGEDAVTGRLVREPRCWEAVTTSPDLYPLLFLTFTEAIERGSAEEHYLAVDRGTGEIDAMLDLPIGEHILGPVSSRSREAVARFRTYDKVGVLPIEIVWSPERQVVQPGDVVTLGLAVNNAHDARAHLTDSLGQLDTEVDARVGASITYQVPPDWDGTPIRVTATSLSADGLRQPDHRAYRGEVAGSAWLVGEREPALYLDPSPTCLDEGQTIRFQAFDEPLVGNAVPVTWAADGGSIEDDGTFTAPADAGEVTVTATSIEDPDLSTAMTLTIGPCTACAWTISAHGLLGDEPSAERSGSEMTLLGLDWDTGAFTTLILDDGGGTVFNVDREPSNAAERPMHVHHPFGYLVRHSWEYRGNADYYTSNPDFWGRGRENAIVGDHVEAAQAQLQLDVVTAPSFTAPVLEGDVPTIRLRGEISGPIVVGKHVTGTLDGNPPYNSIGNDGEPLYGTVTISLEGAFQEFIQTDSPAPGASCGWAD